MPTAGSDRRARDLFEVVIDLAETERDAFLADACRDHPELRRDVEGLLRSAIGALTAEVLPPLLPDAAASGLAGGRLGPYRVLREIGEGGMGIVYLAEREDVGKTVALKLLRHGRLASDDELRRFLRERRVLAPLEHPGIVRLLDAGVTEGRLPYLVMEYVAGTPLDRHCDEHHLSVEARLALFLQVCDAVQYAHRNLIVHRDLKPSNILVTAEGATRLLDFGIAKLLSEEAEVPALTRPGLPLLTPEYASPEQVRNGPVTTGSDIYALGVVLYELLAGERPYRLAEWTAAELERVICHEAPEPPSSVAGGGRTARRVKQPLETSSADCAAAARAAARGLTPKRLQRRLAGDLDTIVLKALRKEPERRYHSVQEVREDVERHLGGLPIRAHGDSLRYRTRKFVSRHRGALAGAALVFLALAGGLLAALWQNREARRGRNLAVRAANTMIFELAEGLSRMTGPTASRLGLLNKASAVFDEIESTGSASLEHDRQNAAGNRVLADTYTLLGGADSALRYATRAETQSRGLAAEPEAMAGDSILLAGALVALGDAQFAAGQEKSALAAFGEAATLSAQLTRHPGAPPEAYRLLSRALQRKGDRLWYVSALDSAAGLYGRALAASEAFLQRDGRNPEAIRLHAGNLERAAYVLQYSGKIEASCVKYEEMLGALRRAASLAPNDATILRDLAVSMEHTGACSIQDGNLAEAISVVREATAIQRRLLASDPANTLVAAGLMGGLSELASALRKQGNLRGSIWQLREAVAVGEEFHARGVTEPWLTGQTVIMIQLLADELIANGGYGEAARTLNRAQSFLDALMKQRPDNTEYPRLLAEVTASTGDLLERQGQTGAALARRERALELYEGVANVTRMSRDLQHVALAHYKLAMLLSHRPQAGGARQELLAGRKILLDLRAAGQLSNASDGYREYLPNIERALKRSSR